MENLKRTQSRIHFINVISTTKHILKIITERQFIQEELYIQIIHARYTIVILEEGKRPYPW